MISMRQRGERIGFWKVQGFAQRRDETMQRRKCRVADEDREDSEMYVCKEDNVHQGLGVGWEEDEGLGPWLPMMELFECYSGDFGYLMASFDALGRVLAAVGDNDSMVVAAGSYQCGS
jgi:hypothetical protein